MRFRCNALKIWVIGAAFRACRGGVGVIENVEGRFYCRRGIHKAFIVTR